LVLSTGKSASNLPARRRLDFPEARENPQKPQQKPWYTGQDLNLQPSDPKFVGSEFALIRSGSENDRRDRKLGPRGSYDDQSNG
jgi:hypothetical protein